jgi:hypothetical protein
MESSDTSAVVVQLCTGWLDSSNTIFISRKSFTVSKSRKPVVSASSRRRGRHVRIPAQINFVLRLEVSKLKSPSTQATVNPRAAASQGATGAGGAATNDQNIIFDAACVSWTC